MNENSGKGGGSRELSGFSSLLPDRRGFTHESREGLLCKANGRTVELLEVPKKGNSS